MPVPSAPYGVEDPRNKPYHRAEARCAGCYFPVDNLVLYDRKFYCRRCLRVAKENAA